MRACWPTNTASRPHSFRRLRALVATAIVLGAALAVRSAPPPATEIDALIRRLSSDDFDDREAASKPPPGNRRGRLGPASKGGGERRPRGSPARPRCDRGGRETPLRRTTHPQRPHQRRGRHLRFARRQARPLRRQRRDHTALGPRVGQRNPATHWGRRLLLGRGVRARRQARPRRRQRRQHGPLGSRNGQGPAGVRAAPRRLPLHCCHSRWPHGPYRLLRPRRACRLWDVETGKIVHHLLGHTASVMCAAVSPDGKLGVTGSGQQDRTLRSMGS